MGFGGSDVPASFFRHISLCLFRGSNIHSLLSDTRTVLSDWSVEI